jgi:hypothetical protein
MNKLEEIFQYLKQEPVTSNPVQLSENPEIAASNFNHKFKELEQIFKFLEAKFALTQQAFELEASENRQWTELTSQKSVPRNNQSKNSGANYSHSTKKSGTTVLHKSLMTQVNTLNQKLGVVSAQRETAERTLSLKQEKLRQLEADVKSLRLENTTLELNADSTESFKQLNDQIHLSGKFKEKIQMLSCFEEVIDETTTNKLSGQGLLSCFQQVLEEHELLASMAELQRQIEFYEKLLATSKEL